MLHVAHDDHAGHSKITISTIDTDVGVLAASLTRILKEDDEVWVSFGMSKVFRFSSAHEMARALGHEKTHALFMFHNLIGCDTVSCFVGHGKRTACAV